jgi:hypothetical protein
MKNILTFLDGKKTFLVSIVTIIYALTVIGWMNNSWNEAMDMIFAALGISALRSGIKKVE